MLIYILQKVKPYITTQYCNIIMPSYTFTDFWSIYCSTISRNIIRVIDLEYKSNIIIQCAANLMRRFKTFLEHCEYSHGSN